MEPAFLATEDELSEQVGHILAEEAGFAVENCFRKQGFGYLKSRIPNFFQIAARQPVILITDLDRVTCPLTLMNEWFNGRTKPNRLIFRVAVREIESWLLADHIGIKSLMGMRISNLPLNPDSLIDPKRHLLQIAKKAPREVREDLLPQTGAISSQGLGYNSRMCAFARDAWSPARAAERSPSLERARRNLRQLRASLATE